jgi:hypothetical protein
MTKGYEYRPLNQSTSDIRLLRLLPQDGDDKLKNIPACQIFHASLRKNPEFVALSYVWGDTGDARIILVESRPVKVTTNLYDAMMALRPLGQPIIIWIDFLCINQLDTEEKCWQVALMGNIYRQAQKVIAWLGPADDSSDLVLVYLNDLGRRADACGLAMGPEACIGLWQAMVSNPSSVQEPPGILNFILKMIGGNQFSTKASLDILHSIDGWHGKDRLLPMVGLKQLFRRSWWGRVWVLQEIALPRHAEFVCGTKRISRRLFSAAYNAYYALWEILALQSQTERERELEEYHCEVLFAVSHRPKVMLSAWRIHQHSVFPLLALLRATSVPGPHLLGRDGYQHLESSDPRDKIYALLGLANDREDLESRGVFPNYKKAESEVFKSVTVALLQQGHISILSICRSPEAPLDSPSWVPDWSRPMPATLQDVEPDHMTLTPKFNASGVETNLRNITILRNGEAIERLLIECCVYDQIYATGEVTRVPKTGTCVDPFDWLYETLRLTYQRNNLYVNFGRRLRAVVRASVGGITAGYNKLTERMKDDSLDARCREALYLLMQGVRKIERPDITLDLRDYIVNKQVANPFQKEEEKSGGSLIMDYMRISAGRSVIATGKGHPALVSRHAKRGDIVALVRGAQVPFILRRHVNKKYSIVGEAYVDGIMDGEAVESAVWESLDFI